MSVGEGESYTGTLLIDALDAFIDYYAQGNFTKCILSNEEGHECEIYGERQKGSTRSRSSCCFLLFSWAVGNGKTFSGW